MKRSQIALAMALITTTSTAVIAGSVMGNGGATEVTQIENMIQLGKAYEQQIEQYTRQGLQLEAELKNLVNNPTSLLGADAGRLINGVGQIMSNGNAIGGNLATIDQRFASTFKSPQALTFSKAFTQWHSTSTDTLQAALSAAGMHRDQFATDTDALTALYNHSQNTNGALDAAQTLAQMNALEIQHLQGLSDLISSQNIAASTYMAAQTSTQMRKQADLDALNGAAQATFQAPQPMDTTPLKYSKWGLYKPTN